MLYAVPPGVVVFDEVGSVFVTKHGGHEARLSWEGGGNRGCQEVQWAGSFRFWYWAGILG